MCVPGVAVVVVGVVGRPRYMRFIFSFYLRLTAAAFSDLSLSCAFSSVLSSRSGQPFCVSRTAWRAHTRTNTHRAHRGRQRSDGGMGTFGRPENRVNVVFLSLSFSPLRRSGFSERNRRRKLTKMVTTKSRAQKIRAYKMRVTDDRRHARVKLNGLRRMRAPFKKRAYYLRNPSLLVLAFPFSSLLLPRARALSRYTYTLPRSSFHPLFHTPLSVWRPQPRLLSSFFPSARPSSPFPSLLLLFSGMHAKEQHIYLLYPPLSLSRPSPSPTTTTTRRKAGGVCERTPRDTMLCLRIAGLTYFVC